MTTRWADRDEATLALNAAKSTPTDSLPAAPIRPAGPIIVEQITDVDTYVVQVTLIPTPDLVTQLCRALDGRSGLRALVSHVAPENPEHQRALRELTTILADTFTVTLTPEQAELLSNNLYGFSIEPERCFFDEKFSTVTVNGVPLCGAHASALDQMQQVTS